MRPFSDVLHAAPCRLHHLIMRAAAPVNVAVAEAHCHIIDQLRHLKTLQLAIASMLGNQLRQNRLLREYYYVIYKQYYCSIIKLSSFFIRAEI